MAKYFLTNNAVDDLSGIWNHTCNVWSERQADKFYNQLIDYCQDISDNHKLGKRYDEIDNSILGYKANQNIIFYWIKQQDIEIVRILHGKMDLKSKIQE